MYDNYKVYGPYNRSDDREHVVLIDGDNRKTISYPKFLLEQHIGRKLESDEVVHHLDGDKTNNDLDNLVVRDREDHSFDHAKKLAPQSFVCPMCGETFTLRGKKLYEAKFNRERGKAGPFCSNKCVGLYGALVQQGKMEELEPQEIETDFMGEYAN